MSFIRMIKEVPHSLLKALIIDFIYMVYIFLFILLFFHGTSIRLIDLIDFKFY